MEHLTIRDRQLVAIGAALGCNCIPCIESRIPKARQAGVSDSQIKEAIDLADELRKVPAAKVLKAALTVLGDATETKPESVASTEETSCGGA